MPGLGSTVELPEGQEGLLCRPVAKYRLVASITEGGFESFTVDGSLGGRHQGCRARPLGC